MTDLRVYRRRLPHWRVDDAIYFVTWRIERGIPDLDAVERDQVLSTLLHFNDIRYTLYAAVVMNDHAHALVEPAPDFALEEILHSWKSFTAHQFRKRGRTGRIWQPEYWDRAMRNDLELEEKLRYIATNPFLRWPGIDAYPYVWLRPERG